MPPLYAEFKTWHSFICLRACLSATCSLLIRECVAIVFSQTRRRFFHASILACTPSTVRLSTFARDFHVLTRWWIVCSVEFDTLIEVLPFDGLFWIASLRRVATGNEWEEVQRLPTVIPAMFIVLRGFVVCNCCSETRMPRGSTRSTWEQSTACLCKY